MIRDEILNGFVCPYCGAPSELGDSTEIYGKNYGPIYVCWPCKAWVGVHKDTGHPLGRLANAELRKWKIRTHNSFDKIWKTKKMTRRAAYSWLSRKMRLPPELSHIGMFDVEQCKQALLIIENKYPEGPLRLTFNHL